MNFLNIRTSKNYKNRELCVEYFPLRRDKHMT